MPFKKVNIVSIFIILFCFVACKNNVESKTKAEETNETKSSLINSKPNIVVLLCDDLGYGDLSSFGHSIIKTPNLDKLAETGIKLTNFYSTAPVCSPSRAGLLTGRSPNKAGIYDFIPGLKKSPDNRDLVHLQAHEKTIPAMLKSAGYATCLVGKWHCSSRFNSNEQPQPDDFGFDHWMATHNNAAPSHKNPKNFIRNREKVGEIEGFSSQIIVSEAIDWLNAKKDDKPFFLEVTFHEPHEPIASPEDLVEKYLPQAKTREEAEYFANVENVDIAVGRLVKYFKENNMDNTLIVFSSDNGPETLMRYSRAKHSYGSPGALRGMKLWTNEAGFRVPGIINWLGKETFTGTTNNVVSALDYFPTFAALAGAETPSNLDGESFTPLLQTGEFNREKPLIWAFYDAINERRVAMRKGKYKIMARIEANGETLGKIHNLYDGNEALVKNAELVDFVMFNLEQDINESEDLKDKEPEVFNSMKLAFQKEYKKLLDESHIWVRAE
ncbi:sulfatase-like hydrolase/transferase [Neotamlana laminarinivorans]|uniref:Sulfatase-like hydrolase/transferase n=1 Tax=Neotamlana laminarinivorans TaxID=2883124 RepID=A0A9X1I0A2_9FLAO|nr:sulfatase-like hydrolase/transferase [Tamlana laminarinivorans]MCB4798831.1 sulfatase-like hydrolase/transferase [Tamlana laminarinivorans]